MVIEHFKAIWPYSCPRKKKWPSHPVLWSRVAPHNLRFVIPTASILVYQHAFFPSTIRMWNASPAPLVAAPEICHPNCIHPGIPARILPQHHQNVECLTSSVGRCSLLRGIQRRPSQRWRLSSFGVFIALYNTFYIFCTFVFSAQHLPCSLDATILNYLRDALYIKKKKKKKKKGNP